MTAIRRSIDGLTRLRLRLFGRDWPVLPRATRLTIFGLLAWCVFAGMATVAVAISIETAGSNVSVAAGSRVGAVTRSVGAGEAVLQRPVFARNRLPDAEASLVSQASTAPVVLHSAGIELRGVFINGKVTKAFMTTSQEPAGVWVASDNLVDGWRLVAVRPNEVELEGKGRRVIVPYSTGAAGK